MNDTTTMVSEKLMNEMLKEFARLHPKCRSCKHFRHVLVESGYCNLLTIQDEELIVNETFYCQYWEKKND